MDNIKNKIVEDLIKTVFNLVNNNYDFSHRDYKDDQRIFCLTFEGYTIFVLPEEIRLSKKGESIFNGYHEKLPELINLLDSKVQEKIKEKEESLDPIEKNLQDYQDFRNFIKNRFNL